MDNLEKIRKAWAMGWSALINDGKHNYTTIFIGSRGQVVVRREGELNAYPITSVADESQLKITGYLYAGELAGSEIPEGQKFRVRESGVIFQFGNLYRNRICPVNAHHFSTDFDKSEIEPHFE